MTLGATRSRCSAYDIGKATARELRAVGITWNFAPNLDILGGRQNSDVVVRSFSNDANVVAHLGCGFIEGQRLSDVAPCARYFPYTGPPRPEDSYARVTDVKRALLRDDYLPWDKTRWTSGLDCVMLRPLHSLPEPMLHPREVVKYTVFEYIRNGLDFDGLIVSDCSDADCPPPEPDVDSAVFSLQTGSDVVILPETDRSCIRSIEAIYDAVKDGHISQSRIDDSVSRMEQLKAYYLRGGWDLYTNSPGQDALDAMKPRHEAIARNIYEQSITAVRMNSDTMLAFREPNKGDILVLLTPQIRPTTHSLDGVPSDPFEVFGKALFQRHAKVRHVSYELLKGINSAQAAIITRASSIVLVTCSSLPSHQDAQVKLAAVVRRLCKNTPLVVVAACSPWDLLFDESGKYDLCELSLQKY
jgi:beta-N-acetylhexosaminidase